MKAVGLRFLFVVGVVIGVVLAGPIFLWALLKRARPIHFDGAVLEGELVAAQGQAAGARLAGPALVRLSGGLGDQAATGKDVLGLAIRCQRGPFDEDLGAGDQDLILGTFRSFLSLPRTIGQVRVTDYLANDYLSVTPWRVRGLGVVHLRAVAPRTEPGEGRSRLDRLDRDLAAGTAALELVAERGGERLALARLVLRRRLDSDGRALRTRMTRTGRGFHPTGARNGVRFVVYPVSQAARRLRGG
ncbi:MAG: hypothetical protein HS111_17510 [Kofleriaceae bacterium]|nr:hypothetical protein [Kofleriaceae bacterium]MCL4224260.1 hypothetical protein [Myxococcales bacterium]